ncbi:MAG: ComGF family competence protein [Candidatus Saccharicenans sp.]|nr:ComGF family competence protein [Candidatus Saccharicenans sp.]
MKIKGLRQINPHKFSPRNSSQSPDRSRAGFSLLECLINLSLSLLILVSALEVSVQARRVFLKLREQQEKSLAAAVALEKIREDLETAGAGIPGPLPDSYLAPVQIENQKLTVFSAQEKTALLADAAAGQDSLLVETKSGLSGLLKKGRAVYLANGASGRLIYITAVSENRLTFSPPLDIAFEASGTEVIILEKVEHYLDSRQRTLRRRVNGTTGQPLAEDVTGFTAFYQKTGNLVTISLTTESGDKNHECELVMYPKNLGRSGQR